MKHLGTVRLETPRLILRRFRAEDAEDMFKNWASDPQVTKTLTWPTYKSIDTAHMRIAFMLQEYAKDTTYDWVMELKSMGEVIGTIGVNMWNEPIEAVHIGYCLGSPWWHQGLMSEALAEVLRFFFEDVGMNRVESLHAVENPHSGDVMKKCGMVYEGTLRQYTKSNSGISDVKMYSMLRAEYQNRA